MENDGKCFPLFSYSIEWEWKKWGEGNECRYENRIENDFTSFAMFLTNNVCLSSSFLINPFRIVRHSLLISFSVCVSIIKIKIVRFRFEITLWCAQTPILFTIICWRNYFHSSIRSVAACARWLHCIELLFIFNFTFGQQTVSFFSISRLM